MHACRQAILVKRGGRRGGQEEGRFPPSRGGCLEIEGGGASVLNPLRSLVPRPGQGRGEGREGGSSRPQRTPPNLERGSNQVEPTHTEMQWMNEWMNECMKNTMDCSIKMDDCSDPRQRRQTSFHFQNAFKFQQQRKISANIPVKGWKIGAQKLNLNY